LNDPPIPKPHSAESKAHSVLMRIISLLLQTFNPLTPTLSPRGEGKSKRDQSRKIFSLRVFTMSFKGNLFLNFTPHIP